MRAFKFWLFKTAEGRSVMVSYSTRGKSRERITAFRAIHKRVPSMQSKLKKIRTVSLTQQVLQILIHQARQKN